MLQSFVVHLILVRAGAHTDVVEASHHFGIVADTAALQSDAAIDVGSITAEDNEDNADGDGPFLDRIRHIFGKLSHKQKEHEQPKGGNDLEQPRAGWEVDVLAAANATEAKEKADAANAKAQAEADAKMEVEAKAKAEAAIAKAMAEAEAKMEVEAKAKADTAIAKDQTEAEANTEVEAKEGAVFSEAKAAKSEAEAKAKMEAEAKARVAAEAKAKEAEINLRLAMEASEAEAMSKVESNSTAKTPHVEHRLRSKTATKAIGDPHLQNIHGEHFDLMKIGVHTLVRIPREARHAKKTLLRIDAEVRHIGMKCSDMFIQTLNVTGTWTFTYGYGGLVFRASADGNIVGHWLHLGKVDMKVVHGHTSDDTRYLNFYIKHLEDIGISIGGLLGEDDHTEAATPSQDCKKKVSLLEVASIDDIF